jgi:hypothetical protein
MEPLRCRDLRAEDVRAAGFDPERLVDYERRGVAERVSCGVYRLHHHDLASEQTGRLRGLRGLPIVTPLRAILDGIESDVRGELIEQAIQAAEQQSLITPDGAAGARDAHAAHRPRATRER